MADNSDLLRAAMDAQGITDPEMRAGIAAICMGESHLLGHVEEGYAHTSNARIREVFGARVARLNDVQLSALKANDQKFFEAVYGWRTAVGKALGNVRPGDGYKYRGRGGLQITGRINYTLLAHDIGHPGIVDNPDLVASDPGIGMAMSVAYIKRSYRGGGFEAMLHCVGNNTPDIAAAKWCYYREFLASGEFAAPAAPVAA